MEWESSQYHQCHPSSAATLTAVEIWNRNASVYPCAIAPIQLLSGTRYPHSLATFKSRTFFV